MKMKLQQIVKYAMIHVIKFNAYNVKYVKICFIKCVFLNGDSSIIKLIMKNVLFVDRNFKCIFFYYYIFLEIKNHKLKQIYLFVVIILIEKEGIVS